jgi:hypothetical protein
MSKLAVICVIFAAFVLLATLANWADGHATHSHTPHTDLFDAILVTPAENYPQMTAEPNQGRASKRGEKHGSKQFTPNTGNDVFVCHLLVDTTFSNTFQPKTALDINNLNLSTKYEIAAGGENKSLLFRKFVTAIDSGKLPADKNAKTAAVNKAVSTIDGSELVADPERKQQQRQHLGFSKHQPERELMLNDAEQPQPVNFIDAFGQQNAGKRVWETDQIRIWG